MLISHLRIIPMHMWLYIIFCLQRGFGIARWFTAKMMTDRYNRTGDVLMAGTGLAIGDTVITYALSMFTFFVYAQAISANGLEKFISDMFNSGMAE